MTKLNLFGLGLKPKLNLKMAVKHIPSKKIYQLLDLLVDALFSKSKLTIGL